MTTTDDPEVALSSAELATCRELCTDHRVRFAVVFGSAGRPDGDLADIDLAVEFKARRPMDDGYTDAYLRLHSALEDALEWEIDLVDVHSMSPRFASVVFEDGVRILGTADRQRVLEAKFTGERPSVSDARERVAAAIDRLRKEKS